MIGAHPDDIEGCAGGLVWTLTQQGTEVFYLIVTNGDKGCGNNFCASWGPEQLAYQRSLEAVAAAQVLGVPATNVILLDYEDAMMPSYPEQQPRIEIITAIRSIQPDVVMSWFPYPDFTLLPSHGWGDLGYHPDHQAVGKLTLDSVFDARLSRLFPTAGPAWKGQHSYYQWEFSQTTHYLALNNASLQAKIDGLIPHRTQWSNATALADDVYWVASQIAILSNIPATYVEGFRAYF